MSGTDPAIGGLLGSLKRTAKHLYWQAYRYFLVHPAVPHSPKSLLFVCKGNICRSPFAEAMARQYIPDGVGMICRSAGIDVQQPEDCPQETHAAARHFGIDLSGHRSKRINQELIDGADMVFAMEAWHLRRLRKIYPMHREKMFLLPLFDATSSVHSDAYLFLNIRDPYGRNLNDFFDCFERIEICLKGIFSEIGNACNRPVAEDARTGFRPGGEKAGLGAIPRNRASKKS